jgi:hypothetical protein
MLAGSIWMSLRGHLQPRSLVLRKVGAQCRLLPKADERRLSASEGRADVPLRQRSGRLRQVANVCNLCFADYPGHRR